jgi:hypothetical protein
VDRPGSYAPARRPDCRRSSYPEVMDDFSTGYPQRCGKPHGHRHGPRRGRRVIYASGASPSSVRSRRCRTGGYSNLSSPRWASSSSGRGPVQGGGRRVAQHPERRDQLAGAVCTPQCPCTATLTNVRATVLAPLVPIREYSRAVNTVATSASCVRAVHGPQRPGTVMRTFSRIGVVGLRGAGGRAFVSTENREPTPLRRLRDPSIQLCKATSGRGGRTFRACSPRPPAG